MKLMERLRGIFRPQDSRTPDDILYKTLAGTKSDSGLTINHDNSLTLSWVWQAVSIISNDIGRLPVLVFDKSDEDNRTRAKLHPGYKLLKNRPNPFMTSKTFKQVLTTHALLYGNGMAVIIRDGRGAPVELYPLNPEKTRLEMVDGQPFYVTKLGDDQEATAIPNVDVLHIKNLTTNGFWGLDVITYARNSLGLSLATEKHGSRSFKNNARPSVVLQTETNLDKQKADQLLASWDAMHRGVDNSSKTALLTGGMKAQVLSMSRVQDSRRQAGEEAKRLRYSEATRLGG